MRFRITSPHRPGHAPSARLAGAFALGLAAGAAQAGRPMITDDARIVDAKACQVETWVRKNRDGREFWMLPACNFTGNLELSLGGAQVADEAGSRTTDVVLQGKTLFRTLEPDGWSWGLAFGNVRHPDSRSRSGRSGDLYAYVPASFSFREDRVVLHANLGWLHERETGRDRLTWGAGSEARLAGRSWLIAEAFGQNRGRPFYQAGLRHWLVPERVQIDATYGNRAAGGAGERWFSIGLRLLSAPFLQ